MSASAYKSNPPGRKTALNEAAAAADALRMQRDSVEVI
jgi:hypothetical protein